MTTHYVPSATLPFVYLDICPTLADGVMHLAFRSVDGRGDRHTIRGASFKTADLLDALGAVSTADMAREIGEAQREANEWKARAEKAEAKVAAVLETLENADADDLKIRFYNKLIAILRPAPVFALPTEAGVRFTAKRVGNLAHTSEFVTITDGAERAFYFIPEGDGYGNTDSDRIWPGDRVMRDWTAHRLLGDDQ